MYQQFLISQTMNIYGLLNASKHEVNHAVEQGVCSILLDLYKNSTPMTEIVNLINRNIQFDFLLSSLSKFMYPNL